MKWPVMFAILSGVFAGCSSDTPVQPVYPLETAITIEAGKTVAIAETSLRVTFLKVTEDSRCPLEAVCFWAGNGAVELKLKTGSQDSMKTVLNTFVEPHYAVFGDYRITLIDLQPYPQDGKEIGPESYVATVKVEKNRRRN